MYQATRRAAREEAADGNPETDRRQWQRALGQTDTEARIRRRAEGGDANAQYALGTMYADGIALPQNLRQAIRWLMMSSTQGHAAAQDKLEKLVKYSTGAGTQRATGTR